MLEELEEVFRSVFDDDDIKLSRETTANDVVGWDSLTHVSLLVALESKFGIRFKSSEVATLRNVGELADLVERRRGKA